MKKIDFYVLQKPQFKDCFLFACRLAEKAYQQGHEITIECQDNIKILDEMLWSFQASSFLPHTLDPSHSNRLIIKKLISQQKQLFLNLTMNPLDNTTVWERILQIVPQDSNLKTEARQLYRHYQHLGYNIQTFTIT